MLQRQLVSLVFLSLLIISATARAMTRTSVPQHSSRVLDDNYPTPEGSLSPNLEMAGKMELHESIIKEEEKLHAIQEREEQEAEATMAAEREKLVTDGPTAIDRKKKALQKLLDTSQVCLVKNYF